VTSSRDSTMALWSIDSGQSVDHVLAEYVPSIVPLCKFRNTSAVNENGIKVRDLAYNSQYTVRVFVCAYYVLQCHVVRTWLHYKLVPVLPLSIYGIVIRFNRQV